MLLLNLPAQCNSCTAKFVISYALSCKVGELVKTCYNESKDILGYIACNSYQLSNMRNEPLIKLFYIADKLDEHSYSKDILDQGDLFAQGF